MDSPAMVAGIQSGDVIVQMGTVPVESFADYRNTLMGLLPDTELTLTVMRQVQEEYQEMTVDVLLNTLNRKKCRGTRRRLRIPSAAALRNGEGR